MAHFSRFDVITLEYTRQCPLTCAHCITLSSPKAKEKIAFRDAQAYVQAIARYASSLCFTGGEALLHKEEVLTLSRNARDLGLRVSLVTSGYWAVSDPVADTWAREMASAGIGHLCVSWDPYHEAFLSVDKPRRAVRASLEAGLSVRVRIVGPKGQSADYKRPFEGLAVQFEELPHVSLGRGRDLRPDPATLKAPEDLPPCGLVYYVVVEPDSRVFACCGPGHFAAPSSPLFMGDARREPLDAILSRALEDPILETISLEGPSALYRALREDGAIPAREDRRGVFLCQLCLELTDQPVLVGRLREILVQPRHRGHRKVLAAVRDMQRESASSCSQR